MHLMMMGGHGVAAFVLLRVMRRFVMAFVLLGLVLAVLFLWDRSRRRSNPDEWD